MFDKNRIIDRCEQVVESIDLILHWSEAINTPEEFLLSPDELLLSFPDVPWRKIIGLRNIISHEYSSIDEAIIFAIIKQSLLPLKSNVLRIITSLQ